MAASRSTRWSATKPVGAASSAYVTVNLFCAGLLSQPPGATARYEPAWGPPVMSISISADGPAGGALTAGGGGPGVLVLAGPLVEIGLGGARGAVGEPIGQPAASAS